MVASDCSLFELSTYSTEHSYWKKYSEMFIFYLLFSSIMSIAIFFIFNCFSIFLISLFLSLYHIFYVFLPSFLPVFNYQAQSYRSRGIISRPTAKRGQNLLSRGDWTLAVCQGQGMKPLGYFVYLYLCHMYQE
ncbi:hypothetical protein ILYODFUR_033841 [Ilyodon furcidens]|uniref:Uncharacterized protein n=1 Tax=Ilyodon furcidens TaxID=33524 RepID=A0ABV0TDA0_9TELE